MNHYLHKYLPSYSIQNYKENVKLFTSKNVFKSLFLHFLLNISGSTRELTRILEIKIRMIIIKKEFGFTRFFIEYIAFSNVNINHILLTEL
jgi:hypothetical protein